MAAANARPLDSAATCVQFIALSSGNGTPTKILILDWYNDEDSYDTDDGDYVSADNGEASYYAKDDTSEHNSESTF